MKLALLLATLTACVFPTQAFVLTFAGVGLTAAAAGPGESPSVPDFTRGGKKDDSHDWNLGPTGARGWIHTSSGHSALARQILVTAVAKGSPADGILNIGDVILGVNLLRGQMSSGH